MDRVIQINEKLRQVLAEVLTTSIEVPFDYMITVTRISSSSDLKEATVYLSILPYAKAEEAIAFLVNNRKEIQRQLGKRTRNLRNTPILYFKLDETEERASKINRIIDTL